MTTRQRAMPGVQGGMRRKVFGDRLAFVGSLPPPVHGAAWVNQRMLAHLEHGQGDCLIFDIASRSTAATLSARCGRFIRICHAICNYARALVVGGTSGLYISVSGGFGLVYDSVFLLLARFRGLRIVIHHHSFAYLDRRSLLASLAWTVAGRACTHIVLCHCMAERLRSVYPQVVRVVSMSNAGLYEESRSAPRSLRVDGIVIGFLGNITVEKGIHDFMRLWADARRDGCKVRAVIGGGIADPTLARELTKTWTEAPDLEYRGALHGEAKQRFFADIDVLVFPTRYRNEAEPLVIHEALQCGIPVIAWDRGCIAAQIPEGHGLLHAAGDEAIIQAIGTLRGFVADREVYRRASAAALERFQRLRQDARATLASLLPPTGRARMAKVRSRAS